MTTRWLRKIVAFLHDPPGKALILRSGPHTSHEKLAEELQRLVLQRDTTSGEKEPAKRADYIASAADRINLPSGTTAYWDQVKPYLVHPLCGQSHEIVLPKGVTLETLDKEIQKTATQQLADWIQSLDGHSEKYKLLYLYLWYFLYEEIARSVGNWVKLLPADTRQPDHSLQQHLSISAAIADALPEPAFLVFSVGPVQDSIVSARRTQDLWIGSWLLSYLTWTAIQTLADTFGPDVVVFPSLRGQPLCNYWLYEKYGLPCRPQPTDLARPNLPNKFVALLPNGEAEEAAKRAEQAIHSEWKELAESVYKSLKDVMLTDGQTDSLWLQQIENHLETYWVVFPWPGSSSSSGVTAENVKELYKRLLHVNEDWPFARVYEALKNYGQYSTNWGTVYGLIYDLADRLFAARKNLRNFAQVEETGEKCTQCGQRAALRSQQMDAREFWSNTAEKLRQVRQYDIKPDGKERLCAVCTTKRFAFSRVLKEKFCLEGEINDQTSGTQWQQAFPPTSEIATATYKEQLLNLLASNHHQLGHDLEKFLQYAQPLRGTLPQKSIPFLDNLVAKLPDQKSKELARQLLRLDGEYLMRECWTVERLQEVWEEVNENQVNQGRKLLAEVQRHLQASPTKYYALLFMDGDRMGQWLNGTHDGLAKFVESFHPFVREQLKQDTNWQNILSEKRLITPAIHAAISQALGHFALKVVPHIVEQRYPGRLIYAGGDDVLALVPLAYALAVARELRAAFSGHIRFDEQGQLRACLCSDAIVSGYITWNNEVLLTMGPTATASIGMAVVHFQHPLDAALQAVRQAEKAAKNVYGRNALCIQILKRSGEVLTTGTSWCYDGLDVLALLDDIRGRIEDGRISSRWPYIVSAEVPTLAALPKEAQKAELKRTLMRQGGEQLSKEERQRQSEELVGHLMQWAEKQGLEVVAEWLLVCSFLARGGEI